MALPHVRHYYRFQVVTNDDRVVDYGDADRCQTDLAVTALTGLAPTGWYCAFTTRGRLEVAVRPDPAC